MKPLYTYLNRFLDTEKETDGSPEKQQRTHERIAHCVQVVSSQLPNNRALSVDISQGGLCLEVFESIPEGTPLKLEVDVGSFPISLEGEVRWCKPLADGIFRIGVSLERSNKNAKHALALYLRQI